MPSERDRERRWQFGLREMFGGVFLSAIVIWLLTVGLLFFVPLVVVIALQLSGRQKAAHRAAVATLVFWLLYPVLWGMWGIFFAPHY